MAHETIFSDFTNDEPKIESEDGGPSLNERKLIHVIRVQIAEKKAMEAPLMATKRLAKYCQHVRDENERLKIRAQNYEMGMARAERRSAQLQNDLYKAQKSGFAPEKVSNQIPFYLPSSIQQLVDSLTAQNVVLMKGLNQATENPKGAALMEKNIQMKEKVRVLEEEIALKTSIINQYECSATETESANASKEAALNIMEQKKECNELKMKLRTYQNYVKHLREKNTAIMQSIMQEFDKKNAGPSESMDDGIDLFDDGATASNAGSVTASREGSNNASRVTSRRESLKNSDAQTDMHLQNAESQTDSGISCCSSSRGSIDDYDLQFRLNVHGDCTREIEELREINKKHSNTIQEQGKNLDFLQERLVEAEENCKAVAEENDSMRAKVEETVKQLTEANLGKKRLQEEVKEAEQIVSMMQEHVDSVNIGHGDVDSLKNELKKCKEELDELPLMQQVLKNYEEEIKSYGQERNDLMQEKEQLKRKIADERNQKETLQKKLSDINNKILLASYKSQASPTTTQERQQMHRKMVETPEPWQNNEWFYGENRPGEVVVHDGSKGISMNDDGPADKYTRRPAFERSVSNSRNYAGQRFSPEQRLSQEQIEEQNEYRDYVENGTVKCGNCGDRFPSVLFQDHFRDCGR